MSQPGFFELDDRHAKLNEKDPLLALNHLIDWKNFRHTLNKTREEPRKSNAGRKPYDVVLMFKILVLQHLYNLSDDELEYQIRDRYSFCRFVVL
ncbi:MAG: transposase, partial [Gammaproteobacteria bacterium]|nr:transposase [Gammaproteobacteria bacterium]MBQ0841010.1 transposase [Gammaproteobacteria bacterium]